VDEKVTSTVIVLVDDTECVLGGAGTVPRKIGDSISALSARVGREKRRTSKGNHRNTVDDEVLKVIVIDNTEVDSSGGITKGNVELRTEIVSEWGCGRNGGCSRWKSWVRLLASGESTVKRSSEGHET